MRIISEEEHDSLKSVRTKERERVRNLQLLLNIRPGIFDSDD